MRVVDGIPQPIPLPPLSVDTAALQADAVTAAKIATGAITDPKVASAAEIAVSKLGDGAADEVVKTNADGVTVEWGKVADANVATTAAIAETKVAGDTVDDTAAVPSADTATTSLLARVNQVLHQLKNFSGEAHWYTAPASTLTALFAKFHASTGHTHAATGSDAPKIPVGSIAATGSPADTDYLRGDGAWTAAGATPSTQSPGDSASQGSTKQWADAGHKHAMSGFGSSSGISGTIFDAKGDMLVGAADDTPAKLDSSGATDGYVLTKRAAATLGVDWEAPSGGAATSEPFVTYGDTAGLSAELNLRNLLAQNEFYWPPYVPLTTDLDAGSLWWQKVATPTGGITYASAGTNSISTLYGDDTLKCIAAASGDGLKTRWTYANERRVKSGAYMAVLCAVYVVTAARTATASLIDSASTAISTAQTTGGTVGSWVLLALDVSPAALGGTYVEFKVTLNGAGTFYVVPLGALISTVSVPKALPLANRAKRWDDTHLADVVNNAGGTATWTDADFSAMGRLITRLQVVIAFSGSSIDQNVGLRRNGLSLDDDTVVFSGNQTAGTATGRGNAIVSCDDAQIIEWRSTATGTQHVWLSGSGAESWA